jgi:valyl-tRNA synthetase
VIADDYVDKDFGTGAVKITPAHDFNDYAMGQRHGLKPIGIFTLDAKIIDLFSYKARRAKENPRSPILGLEQDAMPHDIGIPEKYWGLDRYEARKLILADLEAAGLLVETKPHKLQVPVSQRSDAVIEPMLTDQWFVDLTSETLPDGRPGGRKAITEPALDAVRSGEIKFVPENWATTYTQWLDNIQDWCISRQLWWGHRIPAWYDEAGNIFVGEDEADARASATTAPVGALRQDEVVLDTWFSSALWPFSTLGWPADGPVKNERGEIVANWEQDKIFLPSAVLVTGFDIIFFWVARMVMATKYFTGKIPFREVYINAIVRDAEGQKMSKSKGNTIDPLDLIDGIELEALVKKSTASLLIPQVREKVEKRIRKEYPNGIAPVGADALRFTFAALATYGRTINFDLKRADGYKAFCNKLWNAARFVLMNCEGFAVAADAALAPKTDAEKWILARLAKTLAEVETQMPLYRFDLVAQALYEFVWNDYCDWFVELAKPALNGADKATADSTRHTLLVVLEAVLRALHPNIPVITEEIWHEVAPTLGLAGDSISTQAYPLASQFRIDVAAEAETEWLKAVVSSVRRIRSEMNIAPGKPIPLLYGHGEAADRTRAAAFTDAIAFLARAESQRWLAAGETEPASAAAIVGTMKILIPLAGLIDLDAEKARLAKEIQRLETEIAKSNAKLANFGPNTPATVIEQERQRVAERTTQLAALREQARRL